MGAAVCSLVGGFALGYATSDLKHRIFRKRERNEVQVAIKKIKKYVKRRVRKLQKKVKKQGVGLKVSIKKTRAHFKSQKALLARKADAEVVAVRLRSLLERRHVVTAAAGKDDACTQEQQPERREGGPPAEAAGQEEAMATAELGAGAPAAQGAAPGGEGEVGIHCAPEGHRKVFTFTQARDGKERLLLHASEPLAQERRTPPLLPTQEGGRARDGKRSRSAEVERLRAKHPDRVPVICEACTSSPTSRLLPSSDLKFLVQEGMSGGELRDRVIKKLERRIGAHMPSGAIHLTVCGSPLRLDTTVSETYKRHQGEGGFLRILYSAAE